MGKLIIGVNDLATVRPDLLKEWDYEKNGNLMPSMLTIGSHRKVWWKCSKCGASWQTIIKVHHKLGCRKCNFNEGLRNRFVPNDGESLQNRFPEVAKEWDYEKNEGLTPSMFLAGSNKKVWWKCSKGHSWQAVIACRTGKRNHTKCPYCLNKKVEIGYNDFASQYPELVIEWDYDKNGELRPENVVPGSGKTVYWKNKYNVSWKSPVRERVSVLENFRRRLVLFKQKIEQARLLLQQNSNNVEDTANLSISEREADAIICNNGIEKLVSIRSRGTSFSEQAIYYYLKKKLTVPVVNRQLFEDELGRFEADIYIPDMNLVIEYNGMKWHPDSEDENKGFRLQEKGIRLIRLLEGHTDSIEGDDITFTFYKTQTKHYEKLSDVIRILCKMMGIPDDDIDVLRDHNHINELFYTKIVPGSLGNDNPELCKEWHPTKNGKMTPFMVTAHGHVKVWWKCTKCGYEWEAFVDNRNAKYKPRGCPKCTNRVFEIGVSDAATLHPYLLKKWNYEKNAGLSLSMFHPGSPKKVWWKCEKCGYEWQAEIRHVVKNSTMCAVCSGKVAKPGYNDFATLYPETAKDWDYEKNEKDPTTIRPGNCNDKFWWKGHICGHKWLDTVHNRIVVKGKCPYCEGRRLLSGFNDLASKFPDVAKEWNYDKNGEVLPSQVHIGSQKTVWWKCQTCGCEWKSSIYNRVNGSSCPECRKKKQSEVMSIPKKRHSVQEKCPTLLKEWDYDKNNALGLYPDKISFGSNKKVWWKCQDCGHEWIATSHTREKGHGCPKCRKKRK